MSGFVGVITGAILVVLGQVLSFYFQRRSALHDRLVSQWAELISAAADDLERAKKTRAEIATAPSNQNDGSRIKYWEDKIYKYESERLVYLGRLSRASVLIGLHEADSNLREKAERLVDAQPFVMLTSNHTQDIRRRDDHDSELAKQIDRFGDQLRELRDTVREKHGHGSRAGR